MKIFGFDIKYPKGTTKKNDSVVVPSSSDGSLNVFSGAIAGFYGTVLDMGGSVKNENDLILRYREVSAFPEVDGAIKDIVSDAIAHSTEDQVAMLDLDRVEYGSNVKKKIVEAFDEIVEMFELNSRGADIFERWYIDGRLYYQIILDPDNASNGVVEMRYIDPLKIRKIREMKSRVINNGGVGAIETADVVDEYYIYNPQGIDENATQGIKLSADSIAYCNSGLTEPNTGLVLGYLQKAVKPVNQLKMLEDALVIYRMTRAVERRIFNVDVGNLSASKADQYVSEMMSKYRNKMSYDATTGQVMDSVRHVSMIEDFWLPKRADGKGTTIETLPGGIANQQIDDVMYFLKKLYTSLNVPVSRLESTNGFNLGKASEITRDELKFSKFINRLRGRFSEILVPALRAHCIAKKIVTPADWLEIEKNLVINFASDNYFDEFKSNEVLQQRLAMMNDIKPYIGVYYSHEWAMRNILQLTDDECAEMRDQIKKEKSSGLYDDMQESVEQSGQPSGNDTNPFEAQNPSGEAEPTDTTSPVQSSGDDDGAKESSAKKPNKSSSASDIDDIMTDI